MVHALALFPLFVVIMAIIAIGPKTVWRFMKKIINQQNDGK